MADQELQLVARRIRSFPDFPMPGVMFRCGAGERPGRGAGHMAGPGKTEVSPPPRPGPWVTGSVLAWQGHLAPPEGPRLVPGRHHPTGAAPEEDPRQNRLHRGQVRGRLPVAAVCGPPLLLLTLPKGE